MTTNDDVNVLDWQHTWEHKNVEHRSTATLVVLMDELASEGWELVNVLFSPEGRFVAFMRKQVTK